MTALVMPSLRGTSAARQDGVDRKKSQTTAQEAAKVDKDQQALNEFYEIYRLAPGQNLKHIPPPRPDGLRLFWDRTNPDAGNKLDKLGGMIFLWREPDRLDNYGTTTGPGYSVRDLPEYLNIPIEQTRIEGNPELLKTVVNGDWVFRSEVPDERTLKSLESILQRILRLRITLTFRQVERDVVVARGRYRYSPLPGRSENQVDLYGKRLLPDGDDLAGGAGIFPAFLERVGQWIHRPVVNEVEVPPKERICWFNHGTEATRREDHDESLVLQHLREQTGLTFTRERRRIRVLFIERAQ